MDWVKELLLSLVSATTPVASAVAVMVAPPLVADQVPQIATLTVAPAAITPVAPFNVALPTVTRVTVETLVAVMPRLLTATVKLTAAPTAGFDGFDETLSTCRSGPGAWETTSWDAAVKALLDSFCSATVFAGSTVAD